MNTADIEKDFLSNIDYLNALSKIVKSKPVSKFDSNLIYEVVYADTYLGNLLVKADSLENVKAISDIKGVFDLVISDLPKPEEIEYNPKSDYKNLLKTRYTNLEDAGYRTNTYTKTDPFSQKVVFNVLGTGGLFSLATYIFCTLSKLEGTLHVILVILNLIITMGMFLVLFKCSMQLLYVGFSFLRDSGWLNKFVDKATLERMNASENLDVVTISYDRVNRNLYWLSIILDGLKDNKKLGTYHKANFIKKGLKHTKVNSVAYYKYLVEIEFLYNEYKKG